MSNWKECPEGIDNKKKYSVDPENPRIVTKVGAVKSCTIIENTFLPPNEVTSWSIKILKTDELYNNCGNNIYVGVAPSDIDLYDDNRNKCGWYFHCLDSSLYSGPPHNYKKKDYGMKKKAGNYVRTGESVTIVMDTIKGDLSFILGGVNCGIAYGEIPLDKPLVPCVLLETKDDSVELDTSSEVKDNDIDSSIPVPSKIKIISDTWDSVTLTWESPKGTSLSQIEMDGSKLYASPSSKFVKRGLLANTEYNFRVRAVVGNLVSDWSEVVTGRTINETLETSAWKECPDSVSDKRKRYNVISKNPRTAISTGNSFCTIIGSSNLLADRLISWNITIKEAKTKGNNKYLIGVAPFDIDQNDEKNFEKRGWYFSCFEYLLFSGPPHKYREKEYGPRNKSDREFIHKENRFGVVMDTSKGELSFVLSDINFGVAYDKVPLDKPLVPCVILPNAGDSAEIDFFEVKDNTPNVEIPTLSNIKITNTTCDSISFSWDGVYNASFYQIEFEPNKFWDATRNTTYTLTKLEQATGYDIRVRIVIQNEVGEWSDPVKGYTKKQIDFSECNWKECPAFVDEKRKYSFDKKNNKIVTKIGGDSFCTIIGDAFIPRNKLTSWGIKIKNSKMSETNIIYVGIAPTDINQNEDNFNKCGWYLNCWNSTLCSGPQHKYNQKEYGPRKEKDGMYINKGDTVGVVMDTTKKNRGRISFFVNKNDLGPAYEGIPLDKPLVPCVLLKSVDESIELIINGGKGKKGEKGKKEGKESKDCIIS